MTSWERRAAQVRGAVLTHLGRDVLYRPQDGEPVTVRAVYRGPHKAVELDLVQISTTQPALFVQLADLPAPPRRGDTVVMDGVTHRVTDVEPDGEGGAVLPIAQ